MTTRKIFKPQDGYTAEQVRLTYRTWAGMKQRCGNPNNTNYHRYGGRGITYDSAWVSFDAFFADMGGRISREHTLDRIDNNGDYTKGNCRWVTKSKQSRNRRVNVYILFRGYNIRIADLYYENAQISHLAYTSGISYEIFYMRIVNEGWPPVKAARMKLHETRKSKFRKIAKRHGLKYGTLMRRLKKGWSLRKALRTPADWSEKETVAKMARAKGLKPDTVHKRSQMGWSLKKALNTPNKYENSIASQARAHNINPNVVQKRLAAGWSLEKALTKPIDISRRAKTKRK